MNNRETLWVATYRAFLNSNLRDPVIEADKAVAVYDQRFPKRPLRVEPKTVTCACGWSGVLNELVLVENTDRYVCPKCGSKEVEFAD